MKVNKNVFIHEIVPYKKIYKIFYKSGGKMTVIEFIFIMVSFFLYFLACIFV